MFEISIYDIINYIYSHDEGSFNIKFVIKAISLNLYRIIIIYFILDFFYILTYSISSIYSYFDKVYSKKIESLENK